MDDDWPSHGPVRGGEAWRRAARTEVVRIGFWPGAMEHPTQAILYSKASEFGFKCEEWGAGEPLPAFEDSGAEIIHLHWLKRIRSGERATEFERLLRRLKDDGRFILWTAHNILPHDARDIELAVRVRKMVVEAADAIHVMNDRTIELVEPYYSIRDKQLIHVPHWSYVGTVPSDVSREEARKQLDLPSGATVFLAFGVMRRYKRNKEIVGAALSLAKMRPGAEWILVIAGSGNEDALRQAGVDLGDRLRIRADSVPNENLQLYFNSADYTVYAHHRSLNSGVAYLSLTFGVPLIAPRGGAFEDLLSDGGGISYSGNALAQAMASGLDTDPAKFRESALAIAEKTRPEVISRQFFTKLREALAHRN